MCYTGCPHMKQGCLDSNFGRICGKKLSGVQELVKTHVFRSTCSLIMCRTPEQPLHRTGNEDSKPTRTYSIATASSTEAILLRLYLYLYLLSGLRLSVYAISCEACQLDRCQQEADEVLDEDEWVGEHEVRIEEPHIAIEVNSNGKAEGHCSGTLVTNDSAQSCQGPAEHQQCHHVAGEPQHRCSRGGRHGQEGACTKQSGRHEATNVMSVRIRQPIGTTWTISSIH